MELKSNDSSLRKPFNRAMHEPKICIKKSISRNRTVLLNSLDVSSILLMDLLGNEVLDERTREKILSGVTRTEVNEGFLDWLKMCPEKSLCVVMNALREDDQGHLVNLMEGKEGELPLSPLTRTRLMRLSRWLTESMTVSFGLLESMLSKGAISQRHWETVRAKPTDSEKNLELFEIVLRRSERTLDCLLKGLVETNQKHVASQIEEVLNDLFVAENQLTVSPMSPSPFQDGKEQISGSTESIRTRGKTETPTAISGIAIVGHELFSTTFRNSEIRIYDLTTFTFIRSVGIDHLITPFDMKYCSRNHCLYIMDATYIERPKYVFRLTPTGSGINFWSTGLGYGCISVTYDSNVLMAAFEEGRIEEYSPNGELILKIRLQSETGFHHPHYALKLSIDRFLISHGDCGDQLHRVCLVDAEGDIRVAIGGRKGSATNKFNVPIFLSIDSHGSIIVIDRDNSRVLLLEPNYLDFKGELIPSGKDGMLRPERLVLDEASGRIFVAHNDVYWKECCVFVFEYDHNIHH